MCLDLSPRASSHAACCHVGQDRAPITRSTELREGWFSLCAEGWRKNQLPEARRRRIVAGRPIDFEHDEQGDYVVTDATIRAAYRIDLGRPHVCPMTAPQASPFHLYEYVLSSAP